MVRVHHTGAAALLLIGIVGGTASPDEETEPSCDMQLDCGAILSPKDCDGAGGACTWRPPCTDESGNDCRQSSCPGCDPQKAPIPPNCTGGSAPVCVGMSEFLSGATEDGDACGCDYENACLEQVDCHWGGILLEAILFVYCFAGLAIVCDDHLVISLETLCVRWAVREDIAGASFMAFGSAAPEIIVNAVSTIKAGSGGGSAAQIAAAGQATALGVGAIIGSGIIAFSLIPGTCGLFAGQTLLLKRRPLLRDVGTYTIALILLVIFIQPDPGDGGNGQIHQGEAVTLFCIYFIYIVVLYTAPKCRKQYQEQQAASPATMYERFLDEDDDMGNRKIGRTTSFVLEIQAEQAEQARKEMREMVEERFTEDEIFGMRRAFALFDTGDGKVARADVWRVLQVLGEENHSAEDGEATIACVELEDEFSVDFMEFCAAMAKRDEEDSLPEQIAGVMFKPLELAFHYTCPPCEVRQQPPIPCPPREIGLSRCGRWLQHGGPWETWYPVTFIVAFTWVSFFSTVVSAVSPATPGPHKTSLDRARELRCC